MAQAKLITRINTFLRTEKTKRDALQVLIVDCLDHAQLNGSNNFDNLSHLIRGLIELKSRNCNAIREYIKDHVSNISWQKVKHKDGKVTYCFKKTTKAEPCEYKPIVQKWWEHGKNAATNNNADVDVIARAKALLTTLQKAAESNHIKKGQDQQAKKLIDALNLALEVSKEDKTSGTPVAKPIPKAKQTHEDH